MIDLHVTNFSQFWDSLTFKVTTNDAEILFDVEQGEMLEFAERLIDLADDCLMKYNGETGELRDELSQILGSLHYWQDVEKLKKEVAK